ncbi:MAG TPA: CHAT domain-containing protein, partial [Burkholderiaceae bacterium]|nr:CHAT domain-containing protein [Burkholderiaceae bacterium]
ALVQRLAVRALPEEAQAPTLVQLRAIARAQKATIVEYTVVYEPALLPDWIPDRESALLVYVVAPEGTVTARRVPLEGALAGGRLTLASLVDVSRTVIGVRGRGGTNSEPAAAATAAPAASGEPAPRRLHRLLIEPIVDLLPRDPEARVIFVPHESLFLVPFAALQDAEGRYVVDHHTISLSPSIHTLAFTQRQRVARHSAAPAQGARALIVGNPAMPSYPPAPGLAPQPLEDLPDAEVEAKTIAQLLQSEPLIGKQATKAAFTARLEQAQLVHLATHGLLDDVSQSRPKMPFARHAALNTLFKPGTVQFRSPGSLALAPDAQDSGLLTADEIAQLRTNANLVVMSACDTGRGTIVGDGVIGLTRSWVAAGVPSVVASLWAVPDEPTSTLMLAFHQSLQQRRDKASALRQAMLQVRARYPIPMAWAAFVLFGEAE